MYYFIVEDFPHTALKRSSLQIVNKFTPNNSMSFTPGDHLMKPFWHNFTIFCNLDISVALPQMFPVFIK